MTDLSTKHIQRLLAEATPGPWKHDHEVGEILTAARAARAALAPLTPNARHDEGDQDD